MKYKLNLELEENELPAFYFAIACTRNQITNYLSKGVPLENADAESAVLDKMWNAKLTRAE